MHTYYKMESPTKYANIDFYMRWVNLATSDIIKYWCQEPANFYHQPYAVYLTKILMDVYQYLITMRCRLHGGKNIEVFKEKWIYMFNMVVTCGNIFNQLDILSFEL